MSTEDPREQATENTTPAEAPKSRGWTQFGRTPPETGGFRSHWSAAGPSAGDTDRMPTLREGAVPAGAAPGWWTTGRKAVAGLALAAVAVGGGAAGAFVATAAAGTRTVISSPIVRPASDAAVTTVADVARAVQPSVVSITVSSAAGQGEGSGVVLSQDGLILTNNHVVSGVGQDAKVQVKFSDGKTASATVVGTDPATDLAVVRAQGVSGLTAATLGDSDKLSVGDAVLAIGSPLGLEGSVTAGIVSALDRTLTVGDQSQQQRQQQLPPGWGDGGFGQGQTQPQSTGTTIGGAIQTDAAINPGNSGGALVNASGEVVGINSAIATNGGDGNIGVGFAIPINTAHQVADQLIKSGKVTHAFLGVSVADATGDVQGAVVGSVQSGSPAEQAGLKAGDLITQIDGKPVSGAETVVGAVRGYQPGTKVALTYVRGGATSTVTVTLTQKTTTS
ncbi:S1C family serine protease [Sphaerisporangium perillae]|uniref:S1C family serine protease n=1 Tax=Sphaerisporangium perillae TaxID=2935860 RepID=UPI0020103723|nr:trypsin-like peptidase domain-containing protein [Sphaerisporangium perillae]